MTGDERLQRMIERSWPGHGPCGWIVYSPERKWPSQVYDSQTTAEGVAKHFGMKCEPVVTSLTDAEREAIEGAIEAEHRRGAWQWSATLRGLLERTK